MSFPHRSFWRERPQRLSALIVTPQLYRHHEATSVRRLPGIHPPPFPTRCFLEVTMCSPQVQVGRYMSPLWGECLHKQCEFFCVADLFHQHFIPLPSFLYLPRPHLHGGFASLSTENIFTIVLRSSLASCRHPWEHSYGSPC